MSRNKIGMVLAAAPVLLLSGCGLYTPYTRPDISLVDSLYREGLCDSVSVDTISVAAQSWKSFFTDSLLQKWVELGLENNTDLKVAQLRTEQAEATLQASRQAFLPSFDFSIEGGVALCSRKDRIRPT